MPSSCPGAKSGSPALLGVGELGALAELIAGVAIVHVDAAHAEPVCVADAAVRAAG